MADDDETDFTVDQEPLGLLTVVAPDGSTVQVTEQNFAQAKGLIRFVAEPLLEGGGTPQALDEAVRRTAVGLDDFLGQPQLVAALMVSAGQLLATSYIVTHEVGRHAVIEEWGDHFGL